MTSGVTETKLDAWTALEKSLEEAGLLDGMGEYRRKAAVSDTLTYLFGLGFFIDGMEYDESEQES